MAAVVARPYNPHSQTVFTADIDALGRMDALGASNSQIGTAMRQGDQELDFTRMPAIPASVMHVVEAAEPEGGGDEMVAAAAVPAEGMDGGYGGEHHHSSGRRSGSGGGSGGGGGSGRRGAMGDDGGMEAAAAAAAAPYQDALSDVSELGEYPSEQQRQMEELESAEKWAAIKKLQVTVTTVVLPRNVTVNSKPATLDFWLGRLQSEESAQQAAENHLQNVKMITKGATRVASFLRQYVGDVGEELVDVVVGNEEELVPPLVRLFKEKQLAAPPRTPDQELRDIYLRRFGHYFLDKKLPALFSLMGETDTESHPFTQATPAELLYAQKQHITSAQLADVGPTGDGGAAVGGAWSLPGAGGGATILAARLHGLVAAPAPAAAGFGRRWRFLGRPFVASAMVEAEAARTVVAAVVVGTDGTVRSTSAGRPWTRTSR